MTEIPNEETKRLSLFQLLRMSGSGLMRRRYFKAQSGRFYRNCPLIMAEREMRINQILPWRASKLRKEWLEVFHAGVQYVDEIKPWDKVVKPTSFRKAYSNHPELWQLDEPEEH